ncbi:MAG: EamA family transporter [Armatimonadota bacterium]|nr:EamA family transporter [Armatimonadota bacterium]
MSFFLLIIAFVLTGLLHVANKALHELGLDAYRDLYMLMYYAVPMTMGALLLKIQGERATMTDVKIGLFMGFSGALSLLFFLIALQHIPGIVAFPVRNLGNLVVTATFSMIAWREKLSKSQWLGTILSLIAIWLIY